MSITRQRLGPVAVAAALAAPLTVQAVEYRGSFSSTAVGNPFYIIDVYKQNGITGSISPFQSLPSELAAFAAENPVLSGTFSYDTASAPTQSGPDFALYPASYALNFNRNGTAQTLRADPARIFIGDNRSGTTDAIGLPHDFGAITSGSVDFTFGAPEQLNVDLISQGSFFGAPLPELASMPVRLEYSGLTFQTSNLVLRNYAGTAFSGTGLPTSFDLGAYSLKFVSFQFSGTASMSVLEADYASNEDYLLASDWLNNNADRFEILFSLNAPLATLSVAPVPEPRTWAMLMAGLGLAGWAARRKR